MLSQQLPKWQNLESRPEWTWTSIVSRAVVSSVWRCCVECSIPLFTLDGFFLSDPLLGGSIQRKKSLSGSLSDLSGDEGRPRKRRDAENSDTTAGTGTEDRLAGSKCLSFICNDPCLVCRPWSPWWRLVRCEFQGL